MRRHDPDSRDGARARRHVTLPTPNGVLTRDGRLLFGTRIARLFGYGFLSVVLVLYLVAIGFGALEVGLLLTLTLVGDAAISLWLTTHADRIGRRRVLLAGAGLMIVAGDRVRPLARLLGPDPGRDHRRHQPQRQRGRPVPRGRAGRPVADGHRPAADARLRLVQPGGLVRDRLRVAGGGAARRDAAGGRREPARQLPRHHRRLRADRGHPGRALRHALARHRGAAGDRRLGRRAALASTVPAASWRACRRSSAWTPSPAASSSRAS